MCQVVFICMFLLCEADHVHQNFTQLDLDQRSFWIRPCDPVEQHFNVKPRVSNLLQHTESAMKSIDVSCYKELTEQ